MTLCGARSQLRNKMRTRARVTEAGMDTVWCCADAWQRVDSGRNWVRLDLQRCACATTARKLHARHLQRAVNRGVAVMSSHVRSLARRGLRARGLHCACSRGRCARAPSPACRNLHSRCAAFTPTIGAAGPQRYVSALSTRVDPQP